MPAPRNAIPSVRQEAWLPQDVYTKASLYLYSEVEGRVPKGAWKRFFTSLVRGFFDQSHLDLEPYLGVEGSVSGSAEMIALLRERLER